MRHCGQLPLSWSSLMTAILTLAWRTTAQTDVPDLGTLLAGQKDLSIYYGLLQQYPKIMLQLPNYGGITVRTKTPLSTPSNKQLTYPKIIAPNNEAFTKFQNWDLKNETLVTKMLEYHILQSSISVNALLEGPTTYASTLLTDTHLTNVTTGQKVLIDKQPGDVVVFTSGIGSRSTLIEADLAFRGGYVQIVDTLMIPPLRLEPTMRDNYKDLVAFLSALYAADLVPTFAESPNVTIFAPRNAAFQLLSGTLSNLTKDQLATVLKYHLIPNQLLLGNQLSNNTNLTTASLDAAGNPVPAHLLRAGNNLYVDSAQVIQPDILIANGVVHMIGSVLNPDAYLARPNPEIGTQAPVFPLSGSTATGSRVATPFLTALPCTVSCPVPTTSENVTEVVATSSRTSLRTTSSSGLAAGGPRCTGLGSVGRAGLGLGLLGVGLGVVGVA